MTLSQVIVGATLCIVSITNSAWCLWYSLHSFSVLLSAPNTKSSVNIDHFPSGTRERSPPEAGCEQTIRLGSSHSIPSFRKAWFLLIASASLVPIVSHPTLSISELILHDSA